MIGLTNVKRNIQGELTVTISCAGPTGALVHILHNGMDYVGINTNTITVAYGDSIEYWATATNYYESSHVVQASIITNFTDTIGALTLYPKLTVVVTTQTGTTTQINGATRNTIYLTEGSSYTYSVSKTNYNTKTGSGTMPATDTEIYVNYLDLANIDKNVENANATIYSETLYAAKTLNITLTGGSAISSNTSAYPGVEDKYDLVTGGTAQCITSTTIPANSIITLKTMAGGYGYNYGLNGGVGVGLWIKQPTDSEAVCVLVAGGAGCGKTYVTVQNTYYYAAGGGGYNGGFAECYSSGTGTSGNKENTSGYSIDGTKGNNMTIVADTATGQYSQYGDTNRGGTGYKGGICANATLTNGTKTTQTTQPTLIPGHVTITFS